MTLKLRLPAMASQLLNPFKKPTSQFFGWGLACGFGMLCASVCAQAKIRVVTTLPSFGDIAEQVGGDDISVTALTKGTQDPHFVDAKPDLILYLSKADLVIRAGLGLEDGWLPPLLTGSRNGAIQTGSKGDLNASTLVELREVPQDKLDRASGDVHPGGNPHYMLDPRSGIAVARGIADRLSQIDAEKAGAFRHRADEYIKKLEAKIAGWNKENKKLLSGKPVVTYHRSWIYFTSWMGMNEMEHVEPKPGIQPSPEHVVKLIRAMKAQNTKLILMEPFYPKGVADDIARNTGATLLVLPAEVRGVAEAKTYFDMFDIIFADLAQALKGSGPLGGKAPQS